MQKAVIYLKSEYSHKVKDLICFTNKLHPLIAYAKNRHRRIDKIYIEKKLKKKGLITSFKRMLNYLKNQPEIDTVIMSAGEKVIFDYKVMIKLLELEKSIHIVYGADCSRIMSCMKKEEDKNKTNMRIL